MPRLYVSWFLLCCLVSPPVLALEIVVSNRPLHSLLLNLISENDTVGLLIDQPTSVHHFALRPGQIRQLQQADLVVWIGDRLESGLGRPIRQLSTAVLTLDEFLLAAHDGDQNLVDDSHFWLDPLATREVVEAITDRLVTLNPQSQTSYTVNRDRLQRRLVALDHEIEHRYAEHRPAGMVVLHDAYRWHQRRYRLPRVRVVNLDGHQRSPAVKRLRQLRATLRQPDTTCLLADIHTPTRLVNTIAEGLDIKIEILDPMGVYFKPGFELYFAVLAEMAAKISRCAGRGEP